MVPTAFTRGLLDVVASVCAVCRGCGFWGEEVMLRSKLDTTTCCLTTALNTTRGIQVMVEYDNLSPGADS